MRKHVNNQIIAAESAFARLSPSGATNDPRAAGDVGPKASSAADTNFNRCGQTHMNGHCNPFGEGPADEQAESLRNPVGARDQILALLWRLSNLSPEETRGNIDGQAKALAMIVDIEGLSPDRRSTAVPVGPATALAKPQIYISAATRRRQQQAEGIAPGAS